MRGLFASLLLLLTGPVFAQGFAGLGTEAGAEFAVPVRDYAFDFPTDHGPHPEYRIEWWYLTATLSGPDGTPYGVQWTLFRSALAPETSTGWDSPQIWMGHAGLTTPEAHYHAERLARGGIGQAGAEAAPFQAWIDDWHMVSTAPDGSDALGALSLSARGSDFAYALDLVADGPLIFHGDAGYSVKSAQGQASYYYSQPFYRVTGRLDLPGGPVEVTGTAWLDREWSSQPLSDDQEGWDWFSLQFQDGSRMMAFALRSNAGAPYTSATWIAPDGTTTAYGDGAVGLSPLTVTEVDGRDVPTEWQLSFPERGIEITTTPVNPQSWMATNFPYWEGPIAFTGSHDGIGYLEMTGYE